MGAGDAACVDKLSDMEGTPPPNQTLRTVSDLIASGLVARQFVPSAAELETRPEENGDPIGDAAHTPIKGIVHRYPDRVLLEPTHACPVYCRFCFRREMVGPGGEALDRDELTAALADIRARLVRRGIPLLSQSVLPRGINDTPATLEALMREFLRNRIKPYYLHHPDLAPGTAQFRLSIEEGQALMRALRGRVSGLAQPSYVLDIAGGFGKVPIGPVYREGGVVRDPDGNAHQVLR